MKTAKVRLIGNKPILFDRYLGSNDAKPEPIEKVYWSNQSVACIPSLNLFSSLSAENTKSVTKQFYGRNAKKIGMAINSFLNIKDHEFVLLRDGKPFHRDNFGSDFEIVNHVARLKDGIPNPKTRPMLHLPWETNFEIEFVPSSDCTWEVLVKILQQAGSIGLGTYRPVFGTYRVELSDVCDLK